MRRRELEGSGSLGPVGTVDWRALPWRFHTRMYDSSVPTATRLASSENSIQVRLSTLGQKLEVEQPWGFGEPTCLGCCEM